MYYTKRTIKTNDSLPIKTKTTQHLYPNMKKAIKNEIYKLQDILYEKGFSQCYPTKFVNDFYQDDSLYFNKTMRTTKQTNTQITYLDLTLIKNCDTHTLKISAVLQPQYTKIKKYPIFESIIQYKL